MTDFIDDTQSREERILEMRIEAARRVTLPPVNGRCFNCGDAVPAGRFCEGGECQDDWERRNRLRAPQGAFYFIIIVDSLTVLAYLYDIETQYTGA